MFLTKGSGIKEDSNDPEWMSLLFIIFILYENIVWKYTSFVHTFGTKEEMWGRLHGGDMQHIK